MVWTLSACAGLTSKKADISPTVSDLYDQSAPLIDETPIPKSDVLAEKSYQWFVNSDELAEQSYRRMLELDTESNMRPEASRRLADIVSDVDNVMDDDGEVDQQALAVATKLYREALDDYPGL